MLRPANVGCGDTATAGDGAHWGGGKTGEDFMGRMRGEALGDLLAEFFDGSDHVLELAANELYPQGEALIKGWLIADGHGLRQEFEALFDECLAAGTVEIIECL